MAAFDPQPFKNAKSLHVTILCLHLETGNEILYIISLRKIVLRSEGSTHGDRSSLNIVVNKHTY